MPDDKMLSLGFLVAFYAPGVEEVPHHESEGGERGKEKGGRREEGEGERVWWLPFCSSRPVTTRQQLDRNRGRRTISVCLER